MTPWPPAGPRRVQRKPDPSVSDIDDRGELLLELLLSSRINEVKKKKKKKVNKE